MSQIHPNVIIVGSGLSSLLTANYLSEYMNVIVFTKLTKHENNSTLAQGGVACAVANSDTWQLHYEDTLFAGCYHNDERAVEVLTKRGPLLLQDLINKGMKFDRNSAGQLSLGMEGAHSERRILHAGGDQTGKELMRWLQSHLSTSITVVEHETVIKLLVENDRCYGVQTYNSHGEKKEYFAPHVILATGGAGALYTYTSNNESVTGMALSLAYQAGAVLTDLEFMQFHPTMLYVNGSAVGLISEAVRGEGAFLQNNDGQRFMEEVHPLADLAPRDVVSRAIFQETDEGKQVYLNIEKVPKFEQRFPAITKMCRTHGIELERNLIPVVPGAHFFMGGIQTNIEGQTTLAGLYAVGEASSNGVHGANRLASNSLLETIVFSKTLAEHLLQQKAFGPFSYPRHESDHFSFGVVERIILPSKAELQERMMKHAGIVRNEAGLNELLHWLKAYKNYWEELDAFIKCLTLDEIEIIHMLHLSYLITQSALNREESRGAHFRSDYPHLDENWERKRITHKEKIKLVV